MNWFYAEAGQQKGPVNDEEFQRLVTERVIRGDTLVWYDGLPNWEPLSKVRPGFAPAVAVATPQAIAGPGEAICTECGKAVPVADIAQFGATNICSACKPVYVQKLREGVVQPSIRYAGFWIRFAAKFIDGLVIAVVTVPLPFIFGFQVVFTPNTMPDLATILVQQSILGGIGLVVRMLYTWLLVARYGATLGKMAVKIKIVMADGQPISSGRAFGRYWAELLSQFTCYIGYILACFDDERRTLHDRICNTRVVYK